MNRKNLYLIFVIFLTFYSCQKSENRAYQTFYKEISNSFDQELISHIPRKTYLNAKTTHFFKDACPVNNYCGFIIEIENTDSLENSLTKFNSLQSYSSNDSLLIVGRFGRRNKTKYSQVDTFYTSNNCKLFPVPNFYVANYDIKEHNIDQTKNRLSKDYSITIIDVKKGKFLDEKYLSNGLGMPPKWKNGFSRGYALSKDKSKPIIYWLIAW